MKNKKMIKRVLLVVAAVLLLVTTLVSCGGGSTVDTSLLQSDKDAEVYFSRVLPLHGTVEVNGKEYTLRELFVAASRGYNMMAEGFDDGNLPELDMTVCETYVRAEGETYVVNVVAAKAVLEKMEMPTAVGDAEQVTKWRNELTAAQVINIVEMSKTKVDLSEATFPGVILVWVGKFLQLITKITGGYYVLGLFVFAILVELLLLYFGIRQQKNSIKQARLSPKERAIRKKYAGRNDQVSMRKMQEEIQRLYQEEGFNPMGGCLPLLIQMPIVIALYNIVIDPLRYVLGKPAGLSSALTTFASTSRAAGGLGLDIGSTGRGTIELLSKLKETPNGFEQLRNFSYFSNAAECADQLTGVNLPNFRMFGMDMGVVPTAQLWPLILVPIFTFAFYFASMKLNRKFMYQPAAQDPQMGCSNNMMDITMPLMSVYIAFITPAAVGVYWIFKCIITTLKQFILHKLMPLPTFTEEDYRQAEKDMKAKNKGKKESNNYAAAADGRVYRSLHHIDDEDDLPPRAPVSRDRVYKDEDEDEAPAQVQTPAESQSMGDRPVLKEDRKSGDHKE